MDENQIHTVLQEMTALLTKLSAATSILLEHNTCPIPVTEQRRLAGEIRKASDSLGAMLRALDSTRFA
jgi:hypothetical protein